MRERARPEDTDWRRIAALYDTLRDVMPSPVVDLNRAVAHSMAFGPDAGLTLIAELDQAAALRGYAPLPAAKGDFLFRAGRLAEARVEFERAAALTRNEPEKALPAQARGGLRRLTRRLRRNFPLCIQSRILSSVIARSVSPHPPLEGRVDAER